jgi:hypothetical protein
MRFLQIGAGDAIRTRDIFLGKEVLYQLSYTRNSYYVREQECFRNFCNQEVFMFGAGSVGRRASETA